MLFQRTRFNRQSRRYAQLPIFDDRRPVCWFSDKDPWTIQDSFAGTQVFGATGSGKTSGSGKTLAKGFLREGYGGLVLCGKVDERELWERYCAETDRSDSLLIVERGGKWRYNFIEHEFVRRFGDIDTEQLLGLLLDVVEATRKDSRSGGAEDPFWQDALREMLRNAIDLVRLSGETVSLSVIADLVAAAPRSLEQLHDPQWQQGSLCFRFLDQASARATSSRDRRDLELTERYWMQTFPITLPDRTRGSVESMFTSMIDGLLRGTIGELFSTETNFRPELCREGAIIIIDLPEKREGQLGHATQVIFKRVWQQAMERHQRCSGERPVFLWADESHMYAKPKDADFQRTARSAGVATVYLTQSISNYREEFGGVGGKDAVDSLLDNLSTQIFHANSSVPTNQYAEEYFAKSWSQHVSTSSGEEDKNNEHGDSGGKSSASVSESLDPEVLALEFKMLRSGSSKHRLLVDGIVGQTGRIWRKNNKAHLKTAFHQKS